MFRSVLKLAQSTARVVQHAAVKTKPNPIVFSIPAIRKSSTAVTLTDEEQDAAWVAYFENPEMDSYEFIIGFMDLYREDTVPEPRIIQSALYACRRLNNFPLAMRVLEMVKTKCSSRKDIYDYIMQELQPTFEDLGLQTVEEMGLDQVAD